MTFAVVRVRGTVNVSGDIRDTLRMLRLNRVNHCVIIPEEPAYKGMLNKVKDYVTWGEVETDVLSTVLHHYGYISAQRLSDSYFKKNTKYKSLRSYAKAVCEGTEVFGKLKGVNPVLRMHPPLKGYEGIKKSFKDGGALGYRSAGINKLLQRMVMIKMKHRGKKVQKRVKSDGRKN